MLDAWPSAQGLFTRGLGHSRILADQGVIDATTRFLLGDASARRRAA
jgi:hypothetical protein